MVAKTTIVKDIKENDNGDISRPTVHEYLDALERLILLKTNRHGAHISAHLHR